MIHNGEEADIFCGGAELMGDFVDAVGKIVERNFGNDPIYVFGFAGHFVVLGSRWMVACV